MDERERDGEKQRPLLAKESFTHLTEEDRQRLRSIQVGHNLSSVLNNPEGESESSWFSSPFTQLTSLFDRDDAEPNLPIPSVIPPVSLEDFAGYLEDYGSDVRWFNRNHHLTQATLDANKRNKLLTPNASEHELSESVRRTQHLAQNLAATLERNTSSSDALHVCFQQVPERFFSSSFSLSLDEGQEGSHAAYLEQEKLCNWLDLVEVTLWSQTTSQAQQFFNALSDLNDLNSHVTDTCSTISKLRKNIQAVKDALVLNHLTALHRKRKKRNVEKLEVLLSKISDVRATLPTVDKLLASSQDYGGAMALLSNARHVLSTELESIHSLRTLNRQIDDYEKMIVEELSNKFVDVCVSLSEEDTFEVEDAPESGKELESLSLALYPVVVGLVNARSAPLKNVLTHYRQRIINEVRLAAKNSVVEALSALQVEQEEDAGGEGELASKEKGQKKQATSLPKQLAALSPQGFLSFLSLIFDSLEMVMKKASRVHLSFCSCLQKIDAEQSRQVSHGESEEGDKETFERLRSESIEIVSRVCELSQKSVQHLLNIRLAEHEKLQLADFKQLYDKVGTFSIRAEKLSNSNTSIELKGALRLAAKKFLSTTHERCLAALSAHLDEERWQGVEAIREMQSIVNRLISGRLSTVRELTPDSLSQSSPAPSQKRRNKDLLIGGKPFKVVSTILPLLDYIEQYLACAQQLSLSTSCLPNLIELLRVFNERTNKLVLRTEAMRTAGLEKITQKELALASQSLSIVVALIPSIQSILEGCLSKNSRQFEKDKGQIHLQLAQVEQEYLAHREKIFEKFVEMIEALLNKCCGERMLGVEWDARAPSDIKPEQYVLDLTKGVKTFHKSLAKNLPPDHLQQVFAKIFDLFNRRIPELYETVTPKTGVGMSQARVDLRNLAHCLRLLPGTTGAGESIDTFANTRFSSTSSTTTSTPTVKTSPENGHANSNS